MISAFGVEHIIEKSLKTWVQDKVVAHHQKKFNATYPAGDGQQVRTTDAHRIRLRNNVTDPQKVSAVAASMKTKGQLTPISIGRHEDAHDTSVWDGHHRVAAARKNKMKTLKADVHAVTWPVEHENRPAPYHRIQAGS